MKIDILFYAQLREITGKDRASLEVKEGLKAGELRNWLLDQPGCESLRSLPLLIAVNEEFADEDTVLSEGNTVAFLPPVSGG